MKDALLHSGEGKEQTAPAAAATPHSLSKLLLQFAAVMMAAAAIAYAAFVIYVSATYPHSWMEKLQMLPLCIVAIMAMLCTIMIVKQHLRRWDMQGARTDYAASGAR